MSLSKLGVFASLALSASAVLLPPTFTAADLTDDGVLGGLVVDPFSRSAALECPSCGIATWDSEQEKLSWNKNAGNTFHLELQIDGHTHSLKTHDYQLFPPSHNEGIPSFYVTQIDPVTFMPLRLLVSSYTFRYHGAQTVSEEGTELLPMSLQIAAVEGISVDLPMLTINVLKDNSGQLMIASLGMTPADEASPIVDPFTQDKDCNEWPLLCKWKSIVAERIEKMKKMGKGCHKRPHSLMGEETYEGKPPHRFRPGRPHHHPHHRPHHMGHGHHSQHHMHVFARRAFFTIFIPIVVGIFAGTVTYLIGMVLGMLVAIVVAKIRGQEYQRIALEDEQQVEEGQVQRETEVVSEKQEYADLVAYDAPPVYEEAAGKEVDESK